MQQDIQLIINYICNGNFDYAHCVCFPTHERISESNAIREEFKKRLLHGFNLEDFYVPVGHPLRNNTLFYELVFGPESRLVGTGLFELSFREVFTHPQFEKIIKFIYPQIAGLPLWNFENQDTLLEFCNGIFNFHIPHFAQVLPIRLASYFYPNYFLPIFKLDHLQNLCRLCGDYGIEPNAAAKGARLFKYNSFLRSKMNAIPFDNYIKFTMAYLAYYTVELYNGLNAGQQFPAICANYPTQWERDFIMCGQGILGHLNLP